MISNVRLLLIATVFAFEQTPSYSQELSRSSSDSFKPNVLLQEADQLAGSNDTNADRLAFQDMQALARQGDSQAMAEVAICFRDGRGVSKSPQLAFIAFLKSAEADSGLGMYETALCLLEGIGTRKDAALGWSWLTKSADRNHRAAVERLTDEYLQKYNRGTKCGPQVKKWSERGATLDIPFCQRVLGVCYEKGIDTNVDPNQAFQWYSRASNNGDADAAVLVAICHRDGLGTSVDGKLALLLLQKAASVQNPFAIHHFADSIDRLVIEKQRENPVWDPLGFLNRVKKSELIAEYEKEVVRLLKRAVVLEFPASLNLLAVKYIDGKCCEKNPAAAFELASKSERTGNVDGIRLLAECYQKGIGAKVHPAKAASLFFRAAKLGSSKAQYQYALCLESGSGIPANYVACKEWLLRSSSSGNTEAAQLLERLEQGEEEQRQAFRARYEHVMSSLAEFGDTIIRDNINEMNRSDLESHNRWMRDNAYGSSIW